VARPPIRVDTEPAISIIAEVTADTRLGVASRPRAMETRIGSTSRMLMKLTIAAKAVAHTDFG
jgi:hypothetical protein